MCHTLFLNCTDPHYYLSTSFFFFFLLLVVWHFYLFCMDLHESLVLFRILTLHFRNLYMVESSHSSPRKRTGQSDLSQNFILYIRHKT